MKIIIKILLAATLCLIAFSIYVNLSETNYSESTKNMFLMASLSFLLLTDAVKYFKKRREMSAPNEL